MHKQGDYKSQNNHCEQKSSATRAMNDNKSNDTNDKSKKKHATNAPRSAETPLNFLTTFFYTYT